MSIASWIRQKNAKTIQRSTSNRVSVKRVVDVLSITSGNGSYVHDHEVVDCSDVDDDCSGLVAACDFGCRSFRRLGASSRTDRGKRFLMPDDAADVLQTADVSSEVSYMKSFLSVEVYFQCRSICFPSKAVSRPDATSILQPCGRLYHRSLQLLGYPDDRRRSRREMQH